MFRNLCLIVSALFLAAPAARADALATSWKQSGPSNTRVILESGKLKHAGSNRAGVQIRLDGGWWTYWRAPGTSGVPPHFDWSGSTNLSVPPEMIWPLPVRAVAHGEELNLYRNEIVFPLEFKPVDPRLPVTLKLKLTYGVCRNMCVPATVEHEIVIRSSSSDAISSEANIRLISVYSGRQPTADPLSTGFEIREVWESLSGRTTQLGMRIAGLNRARKQLVLVEGRNIFQASEITPMPLADEHESILMVSLGKQRDIEKLTGKRLRITIVDGQRALEQVWVVGTQASSATGTGLTPISASPSDRPQP